jgi:hypothetical protein
MDRLLILQQRIMHRIEQAKNQIHPTQNRAFIESVLIEIDTLNWVLNETRIFYRSRATQEGLKQTISVTSGQ